MNIQGMNIGNTFTNAARAGLGYVGAQDYISDAKDVFLGKKVRSMRSLGMLQRSTKHSSMFDRAAEVVNRDPAKYAHLAVCVTSAAIFFTGASVPVGVCLALRLANGGIGLYRVCELSKSRSEFDFEYAKKRMLDAVESLFNAGDYYLDYLTDGDSLCKKKATCKLGRVKKAFNAEWNYRKSVLKPTVRIAAMGILTGSMLA